MRRIVKDRMWINPEQFKGPTTCRRLSRSFDDIELVMDDVLDSPDAVPVLLWVSNEPLSFNHNIKFAPVVLLCQETWEIGYLMLDLQANTRLLIRRFGALRHSEIPPRWEEHAAKGMSELPAFGR